MALDESAGRAEQLVLLAPIAPAPAGNGLAMRTELFRRSASCDLDVQTIVVPVAGLLPEPVSPPPRLVVVQPDPSRARAGARALIADPAWRRRLARAGALPARARTASPGLADAVVERVEAGAPVALHVMRSYLAPLGVAVAERLDVRWATLDLDEDDAAFSASRSDADGAAGYERVLATFAPFFDGLSAASASEAEAVGRRHQVLVEHIPNAVDLPAPTPPGLRLESASDISLLFVGNLTYPPNAEAATILVEAVLPEVRRQLARPVRALLVGAHHASIERLAGPAVEVCGYVPDLRPVYASATVAVVPLAAGAGTRIKLLEAFAHGVPVVASTVAAAGLEVSSGRHLLLADGPVETAAAVERIVADQGLARRLVEEAGRLVCDRYSTDVVMPLVRGFFERAAAKGRLRLQGAARL